MSAQIEIQEKPFIKILSPRVYLVHTGYGHTYTVRFDPVPRCNCFDFVYRRQKLGEFCKHLDAVWYVDQARNPKIVRPEPKAWLERETFSEHTRYCIGCLACWDGGAA